MSLADMSQHRIPKKHEGLRHVVDAARYSLGGLTCLVREPAFRHEAIFGIALLASLVWLHQSIAVFLIQGVLLLVLAAFEAVNTAVELVVDRLSPDWSAFAKSAKDLGSLAVACLLLANLAPLAFALASRV